MGDEAWLIGRKVDASKKIFWATEFIVFDIELFIGVRREIMRVDNPFKLPSLLRQKAFDLPHYPHFRSDLSISTFHFGATR